ncbi:unnamed protein product [Timema podura]|uniref:Uncharacterized protein n=1 Tax=Timema podura TaxID=61482 RepID=A0ABN7NS70_TIMPD|nr:unnamed protein product [Timema podura]
MPVVLSQTTEDGEIEKQSNMKSFPVVDIEFAESAGLRGIKDIKVFLCHHFRNDGPSVMYQEGNAVLLECDMKSVLDNNPMLTCLQTKWPNIEIQWRSGKANTTHAPKLKKGALLSDHMVFPNPLIIALLTLCAGANEETHANLLMVTSWNMLPRLMGCWTRLIASLVTSVARVLVTLSVTSNKQAQAMATASASYARGDHDMKEEDNSVTVGKKGLNGLIVVSNARRDRLADRFGSLQPINLHEVCRGCMSSCY